MLKKIINWGTTNNLTESEKRFKDIAECSSDWIYELNSQFKFIYISDGIIKSLGYAKEDILDKTIFSFMPRNEISKMISALRKNKDKFKNLEFLIYDINRNKIQIRTSGVKIYDSKDNFSILRGVATDITESKKLRTTLEEESSNYKNIYFNSFNAITTIANEKFINCNAKIISLLKAKDKSQILNTHPSKLSPEFQPDGRSSLDKGNEKIKEAFEKGYANFDWTHKKFTGELFPVNVTLTKIYDKGKPVLHCLWKDLTEEKKNLDKLKKAKIQAENSSKAKSNFLANMSHEIRTPMNGVIGLTDLLLRTNLDSKQLSYAKSVKDSAESLLIVINDILDFSKIEAGKLELDEIDYNFTNSMKGFKDILKHKALAKNLDLTCIIDPKIPEFVKGDPGRLKQILLNLVGNAIKFTQTGSIDISCEIEKEFSSFLKFRFEIKDTGIGISEEYKNHLFEKFTQADSSMTKKYGGTGLGLSISKQIIELMNGEIGVDSEEGRGSTFYFTVEIKKSQKRKLKNNGKILENISDCSESKTLYISDKNDLSINNETINLLKHLKIKYETASYIDKAIDKLLLSETEENPFSYILIDNHISNKIDIDLLVKKIKQKINLKNIHLLLITSIGKKGEAKKYKQIGFSAYLTTPISQLNLHECLTQLKDIKEFDMEYDFITNHSISETQKDKVKILLVEDNETNMFLARELFTEFGYLADEAWNGKEALEKIAEKEYDLIFMDLQMPIMDGLTATKKIREMNNNVPIVAMTANAIKGDKEICLNAGMNDYIAKPIDAKLVFRVLNRWTEKNYSSVYYDDDSIFKTIKYDLEKETDQEIQSLSSFDPSVLMNLLRNKKDKVKKICYIFMSDTPNDIRNLEKSYTDNNIDIATRIAHTIKGASANIGASNLQQVSLEIENDGKNNNFEQFKNLLPKLKYEFFKLEKAIHHFFEEEL